MSKTKKISRDRFEWLKKQHYELWDWLAKNPDKYKKEWEGFKDCEPILNNCFACQFIHELFKLNGVPMYRYGKCLSCPIMENIGCNSGLYVNWGNSKDKHKRIALAKQIIDLEWNEKFVEDVENEVAQCNI